MNQPATDEEFSKKYEAYDQPSIDDLIRLHLTDPERAAVIRHLIADRESDRLQASEPSGVPGTESESTLEEIARFRDVMALHKRLLKYNDRP